MGVSMRRVVKVRTMVGVKVVEERVLVVRRGPLAILAGRVVDWIGG